MRLDVDHDDHDDHDFVDHEDHDDHVDYDDDLFESDNYVDAAKQGLLGGLLSVLMAGLATESAYGHSSR